MFCSFPASLMSSTYTDKNNPFWQCTNRHSLLEIFSQPCCNKIFSNCLSHNSPAKGWPYRFRSRGTTGSSILDHDLGHLCFGRRIQLSGHSDFGIPNNLGSTSIFTCVLSRYCISCLSIATRQSGDDIHDFCCCHLWCCWSLFSEYGTRPRIVFYNITSEYNSTFVFFGALPPIQHFSNDRCPSVRRNELLRPSPLLHRSPLSYFRLSSGSTPKFSPILPLSLSTAAFAAGIFMARGIGINLWTKLKCCSELFPFTAIWSSWWFGNDSPIRSLVDYQLPKYTQVLFLILLDAPLPPFFFIILQGIAGATDVSNFLRAFLMVSLNSLSSGSMK